MVDDLREWTRWLTPMLAPLVPPAVGAAIGVYYVQALTLRGRATVWIMSAVQACYTGPAVGELVPLGHSGQAVVVLISAAAGSELIAAIARGLNAIARKVADDPLAAWRAWRGRNNP